MTDSGGTRTSSSGAFTVEADSDPGTSTAELAGSSGAGILGYLEQLNSDCCGESGLKLSVPAGTTGVEAGSASAAAADTYACPTSGVRESDGLPCAAAAAQQAGSITATMPFDHFAALGPATVVKVTPPSVASTAIVERDAVTGYDGLVDVRASRTLGTAYLGGFPTSGMTAPSGMSANAALDNNYCLRIQGYTDSASVLVGERTATNPAATVAGSLYYYDKDTAGYANLSVTSASLSTLSVTCTKTQLVGGISYTWTVKALAGGIAAASTHTAQTTDPSDSQTRTQAEASVTPLSLALTYELRNNLTSELQAALTINVDLGTLLASGDYGAAPS